jgi:RimJ/RimL family protein N-acetyltransferase
MSKELNHLNQPIGIVVPNWKPASPPGQHPLAGKYCRVERLDPARHAAELFQANAVDQTGANWTYLPYGPFENLEDYKAWMNRDCRGTDPLFYAIVDQITGVAVGVASFLRIDPANGSIEVGHINYSPLLQRTIAATEAMYLMMKHVFDQGYRRYEWKCNALNLPSRIAAQRLGFSYEGVFRQAAVVKGRNRDTAWYAMIDAEWPALQEGFRQWLDPENFDAEGKQRTPLSTFTSPLLKARG